MVLEVVLRPEVVAGLETFLSTPTYRQLAESTMSYNRKLNEERRMRIPYIDGQTGVAQKHYATQRHARERMPGRRRGQVLSYPQRAWRKRRYQYLQYFMLPRHLRYEPETDGLSGGEAGGSVEEAGGGPNPGEKGSTWETIYEDEFPAELPEPEEGSDDSDFEFEGGRVKAKTKGKKPGKKPGPERRATPGVRRRTHADSIPDSEKPFACAMCLARYKTRPGLTYHYNHSHKEKDAEGYQLPEGEAGEPEAGEEPARSPGRPPAPGQEEGRRAGLLQARAGLGQTRPFGGPGSGRGGRRPGGPRLQPEPSGYCDFCLGDAAHNRKTGGGPEELIGCAECGRSGHPTCLQFSSNMLASVRHYPWQCIECKACSICGTSENDDQLLFCDDCDRGYHMYCLVPQMKAAPEGSWSCNICIDIFHKKF